MVSAEYGSALKMQGIDAGFTGHLESLQRDSEL